MCDELHMVGHGLAYFLPERSFRTTMLSPARGLSHPSESVLFHDGVVEAFLHGRQVGRAVQYKIGEAFARQHILPRRWQHLVLVLRLDEFQRALTLGDVPHFSAMETDTVRGFQID